MKIAFCTTCKDRVAHLARTLPQNLRDNPRSTFVVVDYGSSEDVADVVARYASDRVRLYRYDTYGRFHMTHAKNIAHRLGILADVLVNVDADNFLHVGYEDFVERTFTDRRDVFVWSGIVKGQGRKLRGVSGRIAVTRDAFLKTGGYDERFLTWAHDDKDFNARLCYLGYEGVETPREFLEAIPHGDGLRFREYPHAWREGYDDPVMPPCETGVVNFGRFGCGIVRDSEGSEVMLNPLPTRIFGIGLHKTATTSLDAALRILGYDGAHWPSGAWARDVWDEVRAAGYSQTLERSYAVSDLPVPLLYKELDRVYPGSKFILTVRDEIDWLRSVERHFANADLRRDWKRYPISNRLHNALYGRTTFDADVFRARYRRHNAEVVDYFRDRPNELLVLRAPYGWPDLCRFLDRPVPGIEYPREYVTR